MVQAFWGWLTPATWMMLIRRWNSGFHVSCIEDVWHLNLCILCRWSLTRYSATKSWTRHRTNRALVRTLCKCKSQLWTFSLMAAEFIGIFMANESKQQQFNEHSPGWCMTQSQCAPCCNVRETSPPKLTIRWKVPSLQKISLGHQMVLAERSMWWRHVSRQLCNS